MHFFIHFQKTDGVRDSMCDFMYTYLQRKFGLDQMIIEWGYNLHDACHRYAADEHIGLFSGVLIETVSVKIHLLNFGYQDHSNLKHCGI